MSDFRFRLETVRKLKERTEEQKAVDLADAMSEAGTANEERELVEAVERAGREQLKQIDGAVAHLKSVQVMLEQLEHHHEQAVEKCREAEEAVHGAQEAFMHAVTERRAIERLRERREKSWKLDTSRKEQKTIDEVTSTRHGRSGASATDSEGDR